MILHIRGTECSDDFEKLYRESFSDSEFESINQALASRQVVALEVVLDNLLIGYLVAFEDTLLNGKRELAIIRALSCVKGKSPLSHIISHGLGQFAKSLSVNSVRIHSERRGLDSLLEESGYKFKESIFIKEL